MYISYSPSENKFVYKKTSSNADKFCQTAESLYAIDRGGCMFRSSTSKIVLSQDCTNANARITLQAAGSHYKLVNGHECARTSDLNTNIEGSDLYFSPECNDSRLPFTVNKPESHEK